MTDQLRETESGTRGVRRLVCKQTGKALQTLDQSSQPLSDEAVHEARKSLKKARAGLRLLRPALGDDLYDQENACFRDAGRPLTEVRDAKVLVDTLDDLARRSDGQVEAGALEGMRQALLRHYEQVRHRVLEEGDALGPVREALEAARQRADGWPVGKRGWSVLGAGLKKVYRRGRDAFAAVQGDRSVENLHEWRKQAKYLWQHLRVLEPVWPAAVGGLADQAHDLGSYLGDDHDRAVLRQKLLEEPDRFSDRDAVGKLVELIDRRRAELQAKARDLGERLFDEKPKAFAARLEACWRAWRAETRAAAHA